MRVVNSPALPLRD